MTIIDRYIFKELFKIFILLLLALTAVLFLEKINFLAELILNSGVDLKKIIMLLLFISPSFLTITIPMSILLASIMVFSKFSAENEIIAMRSCGLSIYRLMAPVLFLSLLGYIATGLLTLSLQHQGNYMFKKTIFKILQSKTNINIKERVFNDFTDQMMMYVEAKGVDNPILHGVFISEATEGGPPRIINAKEGIFINSPDSMKIILHLTDGYIHEAGKKRDEYRLLKFSKYDLQLDFEKLDTDGPGINKGRREMSLTELKNKIAILKVKNRNTNSLEVEIQVKYAIPFACFVFGIIGVPLGIRLRRSGKGGGFGMGIIVLLLNYLLLIAGQSLGEKGVIPPLISMWLPNFIMLAIGFIILKKTARESRPYAMTLWIQDIFEVVKKNLSKSPWGKRS